jgi:uncharacterized protein YabE (DUF348 family)
VLLRLAPGAAAIGAVALGIVVWRATSISVTVLVNGQPISLNTHRRTVEGAVRAAGVRADDLLLVDPPEDTPLEPGMTVTIAHRRPVIVHVDGETHLTASHESDPRAIVEGLGILLNPDDGVQITRAIRAGDDAPLLPREIDVVRPVQIVVEQGGERVAFETTTPTVGHALAEAGYEIYAADRITPPPGTRLDGVAGPVIVALERASPIIVQADGRTSAVRTHQTTVGALLDEMGLALTGADYALPGLDAPLAAGETVKIVRVRESVEVEEEALPFETIYVPDPDLELDGERVVQPGQAGVLARQVRVRYEDGEPVGRAVEGEWVARPPQAEVIAYGTRIVIRTLETEWGTYRYWRVLHMLATSYSPLTAGDKQPGDARFGLSGTGDPVQRGIIAVDPRVVSLYTYMYVPDYGPGRALDVGGAVKGMRVDLGYDDANLVYWNRWVDVYLLVPVPPPGEMIWRLPGERSDRVDVAAE